MNNRTTSLSTDLVSFCQQKMNKQKINTHTKDSEDTVCVYFTRSLIVHHNWNQLAIYKLTIDQSKSVHYGEC